MASLGTAQTNAFSIGTAELRLGQLSSAGQLSQANSVGVIDDAAVNISRNVAELKGGFPQKVIATAVTEKNGKITATLREYSRRNLNLLLGNGFGTTFTAATATVTADLAQSATSATVDSVTGFAVGDFVVIYQEGKPETVSIAQLTAIASSAPLGVSFAANSLSTSYVAADGVIHIYKANSVAVGKSNAVEYFSASLVQQSQAGKPLVWDLWKVSANGALDYATNAKDFASMKMELQVIEPSLSEYAVGGALEHLAAVIPGHPMGRFVGE